MSFSFDHERLIEWFAREKRDLPWRNHPTPYAVWVSEMMLQQTQVSVVIPYFERWMRHFPSVKHLARASLQDVIKQWEGLGYYSRARNLHEGAKYIVEVYGGHLPQDPEALKKIRGLGPYTIGAIRSFAFHQKAAAVDGNVLRVIARYFMMEEDISQSKTVKKIREMTEEILPDKSSWLFNEGLIELGATICQRTPRCQKCPLKTSCRSFINNCADKLPVKSKKNLSIPLYRTVAVIACEDHFLVRRGGKGEVMEDLYEFPYFEITERGILLEELLEKISCQFGLEVCYVKSLPAVRHTFTKYRVRLTPYLLNSRDRKPQSGYNWFSLQELEKLAFSSGHRRIFSVFRLAS